MPKTPAHILFHPEAALEDKEAAAFYAVRNKVAALAFKFDLARTLFEIAKEPERAARFEDSPQIRRSVFRHFPFSLFYTAKAEQIFVIAVAHDRRRPGYWKRRR